MWVRVWVWVWVWVRVRVRVRVRVDVLEKNCRLVLGFGILEYLKIMNLFL
jgi:hypothetical protein